jgi:hypothetical protein
LVFLSCYQEKHKAERFTAEKLNAKAQRGKGARRTGLQDLQGKQDSIETHLLNPFSNPLSALRLCSFASLR